MNKTVDAYIEKNSQWKESLQSLRALFMDTELKEEVKWGAPIYTLDGKNVAGMMAFKSYVGLWFHQGVFLKDELNLLEQSSDNTKGLRKMTFSSLTDIESKRDHIRTYIIEAIQNQNEGKEIKINRSKKLVIPPELKEAFSEDDQLKDAFESFTPGKKREFADYIRSAKQTTTKERRIRKITGMIKKGVGLHDKYKK